MDTLQFDKIADIPQLGDGYSLVSSAVAGDGSLLFLFVEAAGIEATMERYEAGIGIFPRTRTPQTYRYKLARARRNLLQTIDLPPLDVTFPIVDIFPDGNVLVGGSRSSWRSEDDFDRNGILFDPRTGKADRFLIGDGFRRASIDGLGRIWVAYFDEGIYGNFGWSGPGPNAVGRAGLVCFSEVGKMIWEYPETTGRQIHDCYALNVSETGTYIYFYDGFPLCRIDEDFQLRFWTTPVAGCKEFAVSDSQVLFSGQYDDPLDVGYLGRLADEGIAALRKVRFGLPDSWQHNGSRLFGRGNSLYFFDEVSVFRLSLS